ncbi:hypothetical protein CLOM621_06054 [Clostridium sp. M62/1]|nr:hypothetical protein CLOM621_06054 [Clostridium sp. M62/1]
MAPAFAFQGKFNRIFCEVREPCRAGASSGEAKSALEKTPWEGFYTEG